MSASYRFPRVVDVTVFDAHRMRLTFDDGLIREFEYQPSLAPPSGVFAPFADPAFFALVVVADRTVMWPNNVDLDACVLHGDFQVDGPELFKVLAEYRLDQAS
jgi:Protein of unknown function (DUF2442)